jgi:hypothetical protein
MKKTLIGLALTTGLMFAQAPQTTPPPAGSENPPATKTTKTKKVRKHTKKTKKSAGETGTTTATPEQK